MNGYDPLTCPMPDCGRALYLVWEASVSLNVADVADGALPPEVKDAEAGTWRVECLADHVILVPTEHTGCGCDDPDDCGHRAEDFDWSDDLRLFTANDVRRLAALLHTMGAQP